MDILELRPLENDSPEFISNVEKILELGIKTFKPEEIYVVKIDNWFGDKWINFAGTIMHELSVWNFPQVKIPPFHPNRVVSVEYYKRSDNFIQKAAIPHKLHIIQEGAANHMRLISNICSNGMFLWYSGNSLKNEKGSVMYYQISGEGITTNYQLLDGSKGWKSIKSLEYSPQHYSKRM